jgi:hypothetical protein
MMVRGNLGVPCSECPDLSGPVPAWPPCWDDAPPTALAPTGVDALALEGFPAPGAPDRSVLVWVENGILQAGWIDGAGATATFTIGAAPSDVALATDVDQLAPALARFGTDQLMLAYRGIDGQVWTSVGAWDAGALSWTAPELAELDAVGSATYLAVPGDGGPGLTPSFGWYEDGALMAVPLGATGVRVYRRRTADGFWTVLGHVAGSNFTGTRGRPSLAVVARGTGHMLQLVTLGANGGAIDFPQVYTSGPDNLEFTASIFHVGWPVAYAPPLVYDDRNPDERGARSLFAGTVGCATDVDCPAAASTCAELQPGAPARVCVDATTGVVLSRQQVRVPYADGAFRGRLYDLDERPHITSGFCRGIRALPPCGAPGGEVLCSPASNYEPVGVAACAAPPSYNAATLPACP